MIRSRSILVISFVTACGCAVFDGSEIPLEPSTASVPSGRASPACPCAAPEPDAAPAASLTNPVIPMRALTQGDVRRMQLRLRDVGFDPGPIDGVAGTKTRSAFGRFQTGCAQVKPLMDELGERETPLGPTRQETQVIQRRLRDAGFNPGPVDGIFGPKTKSLVEALRAGCPAATDFAARLQSAGAEKRDVQPVKLAENSTSITGKSAVLPKSEPAQASKSALAAHSQEEVRILQLRLRDAGFDPGPFDGIMGPKTREALRRYQLTQRTSHPKLPAINDKIW